MGRAERRTRRTGLVVMSPCSILSCSLKTATPLGQESSPFFGQLIPPINLRKTKIEGRLDCLQDGRARASFEPGRHNNKCWPRLPYRSAYLWLKNQSSKEQSPRKKSWEDTRQGSLQQSTGLPWSTCLSRSLWTKPE